MSCSGKRKDGWDLSELTAEEGLLEVVSTRQIWRKINYDAMSAHGHFQLSPLLLLGNSYFKLRYQLLLVPLRFETPPDRCSLLNHHCFARTTEDDQVD